ncbi:hypothetical protein [Marinimicrobium sp. ABcell2]|uniref:hypothetical protein n=1 Tax=Marinimicrobium sp. ABcell2 TaxID=3069751 RepID=UPI0027AF242C|nr:hypothetical protein [Marinimicrobium sp. ABcell2]MDQ2077662.1 hypothetical protein [Marinimicrobium sp. ABcell2]
MSSVRAILIFVFLLPFSSQSYEVLVVDEFLDALVNYRSAMNRRHIIDNLNNINSFRSERRVLNEIKNDDNFSNDIEWDKKSAIEVSSALESLLFDGRFREIGELGCDVPSIHFSVSRHISVTNEFESCLETACSSLGSLVIRLSLNVADSRKTVNECIANLSAYKSSKGKG